MGLRVLLVEDNPDHAILAKRALERDPRVSRVDVCGDAKTTMELLSSLEGPAHEVILIDLRLPGLSGVALMERIRALPAASEVPVVLLSTSAMESEVRHGLQRGALAFITKPLRVDELMAHLTGQPVRRPASQFGPRKDGPGAGGSETRN